MRPPIWSSQSFGRRPTPDLAQYRVPGRDAPHLAGPFRPPGGTVTLVGRATVMRMFMDSKIDLRTAFAVL
jgi:hypothetical protein